MAVGAKPGPAVRPRSNRSAALQSHSPSNGRTPVPSRPGSRSSDSPPLSARSPPTAAHKKAASTGPVRSAPKCPTVKPPLRTTPATPPKKAGPSAASSFGVAPRPPPGPQPRPRSARGPQPNPRRVAQGPSSTLRSDRCGSSKPPSKAPQSVLRNQPRPLVLAPRAPARAAGARAPGGRSEAGDLGEDSKDQLPSVTVIGVLGVGGNGVVLQASKADGRVVAVKVLPRSAPKQLACEEGVLTRLIATPHPLVVRMHSIHPTPAAVWYIMDYHQGGDLHHHLSMAPRGRFPAPRALFYFAEVACALAHLHRLGILYRDVKAENVMLSQAGHAVLVDFGLSIQSVRSSTHCGTEEYMAPEVLRAGPGDYGAEADWWAAAVLLYRMATGRFPFGGEGSALGNAICAGAVRPMPQAGDSLKALLQAMLATDMSHRLWGLQAVQRHECFRGWDWAAVNNGTALPPVVPRGSGAPLLRDGAALKGPLSEDAVLSCYEKARKEWS